MTVTIEHGPVCECGCGEHLPIGSVRKYKRGHRANVNNAMADQMERTGTFDGYEFRFDPQYNVEPIDTNMLAVDYDEWDSGWESLQDAADSIPNDPTGAVWDEPSKTPEFKLSLPKRVQADIEGKIAFMLTTTSMALSLPDPHCGNALATSTPDIAKALTPIICQSPGIVAWFQKTSNVMLYVNLAMAMAPFVAAVLNHHIPSKRPQFNGPPQNGHADIPVDPAYYGVV